MSNYADVITNWQNDKYEQKMSQELQNAYTAVTPKAVDFLLHLFPQYLPIARLLYMCKRLMEWRRHQLCGMVYF